MKLFNLGLALFFFQQMASATNVMPYYSFYNADAQLHQFADISYEYSLWQAGYRNQGVAFFVQTSPDPFFRIQLFQCNIPYHTITVSTDRYCEGGILLGTYGYVSDRPGAGLVPLYRFTRYKGTHLGQHRTDTVVTTSPNSPQVIGYQYDRTLGYVPN